MHLQLYLGKKSCCFSPPLFAVGLGLLLLGLSGFWATRSARFVQAAVRAEGTVLEVERVELRDRDSKESRTFSPHVRFVSASGEAWTVVGLGGSSSDYEKGQTVSVLYLPEQPGDGRIESFHELWLGPLLLGVMGLFISGLGGLVHTLH